MKNLSTLIVALLMISAGTLAQKAASPPINWKDKVVGKWKYDGVEQFGVVDTTTAEQKKDMLEINANGTYSRIEDGKPTKGSYTLVPQGISTISFKQEGAAKSKMYYLKKSPDGKLVIEFQTPDLIRTRYSFSKM